MKKIISLLLIFVLTLMIVSGCKSEEDSNDVNSDEKISNDSDLTVADKEEDSTIDTKEINNEPQKEIITGNFKKAFNFSEGLAWVNIDDKNAAVINTKGEIIHKTDKEGYHFLDCAEFSGGISWYKLCNDDDKSESLYYIINSDGEIVSSSENKEYDTVLGCGDGLALVYKIQKTVSSIQYKLGSIDKNGNWVHELENVDLTDVVYSTDEKPYDLHYHGEYIFSMAILDPFSHLIDPFSHMFFNAETGKILFYAFGIGYSDIYFFNDIAYCSNYHVSYIGKSEDKDKAASVPLGTIILSTDGSFEMLTDENLIIDKNRYIKHNYIDDSSTFEFKDMETGNGFKFEGDQGLSYSVTYMGHKYIGITIFNDETGLFFFSVIDDKGEMLFEPIEYNSTDSHTSGLLTFTDDNIVLETEDHKSDSSLYDIYDINGNITAENLHYQYIGVFNDGLAVAYNLDNQQFYINQYGEVVIGEA